MTLREVQRRVAEIKELVGDPEAAHLAEDDLYVDVLDWLSDEHNLTADPHLAADLVLTALQTQKLNFERWYA